MSTLGKTWKTGPSWNKGLPVLSVEKRRKYKHLNICTVLYPL